MRKSIWAAALTLAAIAAMAAARPALTREEIFEVNTAVVEVSGIYNSVIASGRVEEAARAEVTLPYSARVSEVYVKVGDSVTAGQALMKVSGAAKSDFSDSERIAGLRKMLEGEDVLSIAAFSEEEIKEEIIAAAGSALLTLPEEEVPETDEIICSPADGVVMAVQAPADAVPAGSSLAAVSDVRRLNIRASIQEGYAAQVAERMAADITGEGFQNVLYRGVVTNIMPYATQVQSLTSAPETRVEVLLSVTNADERLKPGYTANVKIYTDHKDEALLVPYEAVWQDEDNRENVYVIENGRAVQHMVRTGYELENLLEVTEGLSAGDIVILNPPKGLCHGSRITLAGQKEAGR